MDKKHLTFRQILLIVAFGIVLYLGVMNIGTVYNSVLFFVEIVTPLFYGGIVAVLLNVLMSAFEGLFSKLKFLRKRQKLNAVASLLLTFVVVIGALVAVFYLVIPAFLSAIPRVERSISEHRDDIISVCGKLGIDVTTVDGFLESIDIDNIMPKITSNIGGIFSTIVGVATSITDTLFTAIITLVACIYILLSKKQLARQATNLLYAYVKIDVADKISNFFKNLSATFKRFLSSQCLDSLILGLLLLVAMQIFKLPYAEIIAPMTVIFALIPYFGAFISCGIGAILISLDSPKKALIFAVVFLVIQQIEGNLIYPRIVGTSVGLPALWTLLAVYVGGELFGIIGMILIIPVVSVLYTTLSTDVSKRLSQKKNGNAQSSEKIEKE